MRRRSGTAAAPPFFVPASSGTCGIGMSVHVVGPSSAQLLEGDCAPFGRQRPYSPEVGAGTGPTGAPKSRRSQPSECRCRRRGRLEGAISHSGARRGPVLLLAARSGGDGGGAFLRLGSRAGSRRTTARISRLGETGAIPGCRPLGRTSGKFLTFIVQRAPDSTYSTRETAAF